MAENLRNDPLPVFSFWVDLGMGGQAYFKSVSGLRYESEVVPVLAGGVNNTTFNLVGSTKWPTLVFKQGFTKSSALLQYRQDWLNGGNRKRIPTGTITLLDTALKAQAVWTFTRGWPTKWEISEFDAAKSELAIETLEIAHDGLKYSKA